MTAIILLLPVVIVGGFCSLLLNLLEEALQVRRLVVEELNLFLTLLAFNLATAGIARLNRLNLALELDDFV